MLDAAVRNALALGFATLAVVGCVSGVFGVTYPHTAQWLAALSGSAAGVAISLLRGRAALRGEVPFSDFWP